MLTVKQIAYEKLGIPSQNKVILSLDGGGIKGILTLQLLKKLEEIAGAPCYAWCDMVAGTSTGGIIAGLILKKHSALQIEQYYIQLVSQVFTKRGLLANRFLNPPAFDKKNYRNLLKTIVGDATLEEACRESGLDFLITSKDMWAGEETFFTCFENGGIKGTYKEALLRYVMEATMSAPTYFQPMERFIDGGTTTLNNPVGAAMLEALTYSGKGKYHSDQLTLFSFGTSTCLRFVDIQDSSNPKGLDAYFWLNYVMDESSKDASEMQVDVLRSGLIPGLDFRRYQISMDKIAFSKIPDKDISQLPHTPAATLRELTDEELSKIDLADVSKFDLMKAIGEAMAEHICPSEEQSLPAEQRKANWFKKDLLAPNSTRGELVTAFGDTDAIASQLKSPQWLDTQRSA